MEIYEDKIYNDDYIIIVKRSGQYFLRTDSGGVVSWVEEAEISKEDAFLIQNGGKKAYDAILEYQDKGLFVRCSWVASGEVFASRLSEFFSEFQKGGQQGFPGICPICTRTGIHLYYNGFEGESGGAWVWCSLCKSYVHVPAQIPDGWINCNAVLQEHLGYTPDHLEQNKDVIDEHVNHLMKEK